jgi:uncharacterized HhH-GPD family protein
VELHLSQDPKADALLSKSSFALVVGMVLDQQVPLEWAFASPLELQRRLGKALDPKRIAQMDPEALAAAFSSRPALHRYPGSMATRVQEVAKLVVDRYGGKTEAIWTGATSGAELLGRVKELPGFGEQKAKIFVALLGKQLGVRPQGWEEVSAPFSDPGTFRSVADITDTTTLDKVRAFKQALKAANRAKNPPDEAAPPSTKVRRPGKASTTGSIRKTAASKATATTPTKKKTPGRTPASASAGKR